MKTRDAPPPSPTRSSNASSKASRKPSPAENALVERFRAVLAAGGDAESGEADAAAEFSTGEPEPSRPAQNRDDDHGGLGANLTELGEPTALTVGALAGQAGAPLPANAIAQAAPTAGTFHPAAFAQLLEKHVRQLLVSAPDSSAAHGAPQVMLNLTDAALPGTQITLARTDEGWQLRSRTASSDAYRTMQAMAPKLKERFAERGLGGLDFSVQLSDAAERNG